MADYKTASRTKDHFQDQLLRDHPEIVSIAPRVKLDDEGNPTNEAVIVIGVQPRNPLRGVGAAQAAPIPDKLSAVDDKGRVSKTEDVEVVIEDEGPITAEMNTARRRPCPGGFSIGHPRVTAGTLGGVARRGVDWGFILSNNHVLAATNSGSAGDATYQPGVADGGNAGDTIGRLDRWVPINFSGNNEVDCALTRALDPWDQHVTRHVHGIGTPAAMANATNGQAIRKSGRTTQLTTGTIVSDNATIRVSYGSAGTATFVNQLQYTRMSAGGDSGSLVWDHDSLTVVGLHFAGSSSASYGNKILRVMDLLSQERTVYDIDGKPSHFPKEDISIVD